MEMIVQQFVTLIVPKKKSIVPALPMKKDASSLIAVSLKEKTKKEICVLVYALWHASMMRYNVVHQNLQMDVNKHLFA